MLAVKDLACLADYGFIQSDLQATYDIWEYKCSSGLSILVNHLDNHLNPVKDNVLCIYNDVGDDNLTPIPDIIYEMIKSGDVYVKARNKE